MRQQASPIVARGCMLLLALLSTATSLAQKAAAHAQRPGKNAAVPFVDIISPTAARVKGSGFVLILDGAGFGHDAEIGFQLGSTTHSLPTLVINEGEVAAYVPANLLKDATTASITVTNRHRHGEGLASNPVLLPITTPTASVAFTQANIAVYEGIGAIVTADFNGDGQTDLAVSQPCGASSSCLPTTGGNVLILRGKPDGTFVQGPSIPIANIPESLATGDFNGDGNIDLVVGNEGSSTVTILFGDGLGGFTPSSSPEDVDSDPQSIAVGDFNRDGKLDLAISHASPVVNCSPAGCYSTAITIRLGLGDGTFSAADPIQNSGSSAENVTTVDVNRDGILDLVFESGISTYFVYLGQGDGTFAALASPTTPPTTDSSAALTLGDVNRDGNLDLVFTVQDSPASGQSTISTSLGKGNGLFHAGPVSPVVSETLIQGTLADFNGDGKLDLAEETGFSTMNYDIFLGNGHSTFHKNSSISVSNQFSGVPAVVGDFNGDGKLDLATVTRDYSGTIAILLQK